MSKRRGVSKKTRFEVFKRDRFTCQYCGKGAPDVQLHVDHIHPVAEGGADDVLNLVTSCSECNLGKGARKLSDDAVVEKQLDQMKDLQERREQLEMLLEWRKELDNLDDMEVDAVVERIDSHTPDYSTTDRGKKKIRRWLKQFSVIEILESVDIAAEQYLVTDGTDEQKDAGLARFWEKVPRIMKVRRDGDDPALREAYYVRGIVRNRFSYCNEYKALQYIRAVQDLGYSFEDLKRIAIEAKHWSAWRTEMEDIIEGARTENE